MFDGRTEADTAQLDGKKGLSLGRVGERLADDARKGGELLRVEVGVGGLEVKRVAGPEAVSKRGEREAVTEKGVLGVGVVERREKIKDDIDLFDALHNNVAAEGNIPHRRP